MEKVNSDPQFRSYTKSNPKWITDLNTEVKTIKHGEENRRKSL